MVYLCLESFGGVSHDIPKNVSENKTLHLNPKKIQLVWKVLFVLFPFLFLFFFFFGKELPNGTIFFKLIIESCSHQMRADNTILTSAIHLVDKLLNNPT